MMIAGFDLSATPLLLGVVTGLGYALLAVGLVLVFRSSGILNLALGEVGAVGAVFLAVAVAKWNWWYWPAFIGAIAVAGVAGALVNVTVVQRLKRAPRVMGVVAMLGVGVVLFGFSSGFGSQLPQVTERVHPPGVPSFEVGVFPVTPSFAAAIVLCPLVLAGVTLFLRKHALGRALRASASEPDLARSSAISPVSMASLAWGISGALAALVAILLSPAEQGAGQTLGLWLLLRPLAAATIAGMRNLPVAAAAGFGIGIVEQVLLWNTTDSGVRDIVVFLIVLVAVGLRKMPAGRGGETGRWLRVSPVIGSERARALVARPLVRALGALVILAVTLGFMVTTSPTGATRLMFVFSFAIIGLSVAVITGLGGELSLGQFAVAGIGAAASVTVTTVAGNFPLGLLAAGSVAALSTLALGALSSRAGGQSLAVLTLAFAIAAESWLLGRSWIFGDGVFPGQPLLGDFALDTARRYAPFAFVVLVVAFLLVRNTWRTQIGRRITAQRDNEPVARAFGVNPRNARTAAYLVSGFVAGLGGGAFVHGLFLVSASTFTLSGNVNAVALNALGGFGTLWGPLLGAGYISGLPGLLPAGWGFVATTSLGWLVLILVFPGGLSQAGAVLADRLGRWSFRDSQPMKVVQTPRLLPATRSETRRGEPALRVSGVTRSFGDLMAIEEVSLTVGSKELVGIVGSNGAGKTTLLDIIGGLVDPDAGRVLLDGNDVTGWAPEARAELGLIRSFENADLFATMTVHDVVQLGTARVDPRSTFRLLLQGRAAERRSASRAMEVVEMMGLGPFAHRRIGELSTGMRRLAELSLVVASRPKVLLLDEPTSGVAQAEVEALVVVLKGVIRHLDLALVMVEHDLKVVAELCSKVIVLEHGRIAREHPADQLLVVSRGARKEDV